MFTVRFLVIRIYAHVVNYCSSHGWLNENESGKEGNISNKKKSRLIRACNRTNENVSLMVIIVVYRAWRKNNKLTKWWEIEWISYNDI